MTSQCTGLPTGKSMTSLDASSKVHQVLGGLTTGRSPPSVNRKRSHNEISMATEDGEESNDSIGWTTMTTTAGERQRTAQDTHGRPIVDGTTRTNDFLDPTSASFTCSIAPAPFSHEPLADQRRTQVDYTKRFTLEEAKSGQVTRLVRVYADGIYDMFHTGHARQLMQAKMAFPHTYLIVGVCSDALTNAKKGRTVMNETERYEAIRHCRYVDEVLTDAPWCADLAFFEDNKIDFVAHDDLPYTMGTGTDVYKQWKDLGMFLPTERTEGVSTTDVITRIIKDYDMYIRRNLARGYSHKELNVSYVKAKQLKLKDNYEKLETKLKDKGKNWVGKWKEQVGKYDEMIHRWEEKSKEFIGNFVDMFSRDGRLGQWLQENTTRIGRAISPTSMHQQEGDEAASGAGAYDSPSSPSTSDFDSSSPPPHKRGRFSPLFMRHDPDELSDKEEGEF